MFRLATQHYRPPRTIFEAEASHGTHITNQNTSILSGRMMNMEPAANAPVPRIRSVGHPIAVPEGRLFYT